MRYLSFCCTSVISVAVRMTIINYYYGTCPFLVLV